MNIDRSLQLVNQEIQNIIESSDPALQGLLKEASLDEGKKVRAKLFLLFCDDDSDNAVKMAAALELLHSATLIHDDVLDESPRRRGNPSFYVKRGTAVSLLFGDYLLSKSFLLVTQGGNPLHWEEMVKALSTTLEGEITQQRQRGNVSMTKHEYLSMVSKKSGTFFGTACKMGIIQRRADQILAQKAYSFGLSIGTAYQILDDCRDYFHSQDGRKKFNDVRKGVITLPLIVLLEQCSNKERRLIWQTVKDQDSYWDRFEDIASLMGKYNVVQVCCREARTLLASATTQLVDITLETNRAWLDITAYMEEKIKYAEEKYHHSGRRVRGSERATAVRQVSTSGQ